MKMDPEFKESISERGSDSSATETCSDPDFFKESDDELSDNEEEREQYIIQYPLKSTVKKEINNISSDPLSIDDPFGQVNKDLAIKTVVCRYCSFACDSDYILFTHIDQNHKNRSSSYTCNFPFCNFKSSNMLDWIHHKGNCKNNPDVSKSESCKRSQLSGTSRKKTKKKSQSNVNLEAKVQKSEYVEENDINQKGKTPIIKVKPDYKLKSPELLEPLILDDPREASNSIKLEPPEIQETLDEPREPSNLSIKLKAPGLRLFKNANQSVLKKLNICSSDSCQKLVKTPDSVCHKCGKLKIIKKQFRRYTAHINPFGDDLLFRIKRETETHGLNDHSYSRIDFFQKLGLNKLKSGSCRQVLLKTIAHLKSKLNYELLRNSRAYPEQVILLQIIHQLEEIKSFYSPEANTPIDMIRQLKDTKSTYVPGTHITRESNYKEEKIKKNLKQIRLTNIPSGFCSKKKFKVLIPKKSMEKILLDSNAKLVIDGHVPSNKNLRKIFPQKNILAEKKSNNNVSSHKFLTQPEPTSSVKKLTSNIKRNNSNYEEQILSLNNKITKITVKNRFSNKITTNKIDGTEINSEEKPSFVRESSNLKRKNCISRDDDVEVKITSSSSKIVKNETNKKNVSEELSTETKQTNHVSKNDQFEVKKESLDKSEVELSSKSSSVLETNNAVPLKHTCRKGKRRSRPKWSHRKKAVKSICHACVEEKFQGKVSFV